jgi:hypothetical protein
VVLPWFLSASYELRGSRWAWILLLHLLTCWLAWFGFQPENPSFLLPGLAVLALNGVAYALVRRSDQVFPKFSLR